MDYIDTFTDALDGTVEAEVIDNCDDKHVVVNLRTSGLEHVGIALTATQARQMAETLLTLAAGLD